MARLLPGLGQGAIPEVCNAIVVAISNIASSRSDQVGKITLNWGCVMSAGSGGGKACGQGIGMDVLSSGLCLIPTEEATDISELMVVEEP